MTTQSANPRRFSKGTDNLDPDAPIFVYLSLAIPKSGSAMRDALTLLQRYREDYPQADVAPVALLDGGSHRNLILEINMGPARTAMSGESHLVKSGYGYIYTVVKNCFNLRPVFALPPTEVERSMFRQLNDSPKATVTAGNFR